MSINEKEYKKLVIKDNSIYPFKSYLPTEYTYNGGILFSSGIPDYRSDGKIFYKAKELRSIFFNKKVMNDDIDLSTKGYDLCPLVPIWIGAGVYANKQEDYDLFFHVDTLNHLKQVCLYYGVDYPVPDNFFIAEYDSLEPYAFTENTKGYLVSAKVEFKNNKPVKAVLYLFPKFYKGYRLKMTGTSYRNNGEVYERAVRLTKLRNLKESVYSYNIGKNFSIAFQEVIYSESPDERGVYNKIPKEENEEITPYRKLILNDSNDIIDIKHFKGMHTPHHKVMLGGTLHNPITFTDAPKTPKGLLGWVAKAWYDSDPDTIEWFFPVMYGEQEFNIIADTYNLPVPYEAGFFNEGVLPIRFTHYNVKETILSDYKFVPLTFGSVVFNKGSAVECRLYAFKRSWEFEDILEVPNGTIDMLDFIEAL